MIKTLMLIHILVISSLIFSINKPQHKEWETIRMRVTAYCPCEKCCGRYSDGITASGHRIGKGDVFVAADKRFSFGTKMIILGYNNNLPVKVLDRGRAIQGNRIDVFFHTHKEALQWGVKYIDVRVSKPKKLRRN